MIPYAQGTVILVIGVVWLAGCSAAGAVAHHCRMSFIKWFGVSLIASPLLGAILLVAVVLARHVEQGSGSRIDLHISSARSKIIANSPWIGERG